MKKLFAAAVMVCVFGLFTPEAHAQDSTSTGQKIKKTAKKTGKAIGKGAKAVRNKTAELVSKGSSEVVDKTYEGKTGPDGQKIFINDKSEYYWVDKKGHRHFVKESDLKDKKE